MKRIVLLHTFVNIMIHNYVNLFNCKFILP